jgi:hypothetical protein
MARQDSRQQDNRQQPQRRRIDELIGELDKVAPAGEMGLEFTKALIDNQDWPHASHGALRSVPRSIWLPVLEADDRMFELIGELELEFGELPDSSAWPVDCYDKWLRLAVICLAKSWGFVAGRPDPRGMPTHW